MSKRKLLVLEDQSLIRFDLVDRIQSNYDFEIIEACNSQEALSCEPDLAICDIELEGDSLNGVDVANLLNKGRQVPVIFITKVQDDPKIFKQVDEANYPKFYLAKPISNNGLKIAINSASKSLAELSEAKPKESEESIEILKDRMFVRNGRGKVAIDVEEMLWWQSGGGESSMVVTKARLEEGKGYYPTVGYNLSKLEERLTFYPHFVRCSRYHIVNLLHVRQIVDAPGSKPSSKKILLVADTEIPVGEKYRKEVMRRLHIL